MDSVNHHPCFDYSACKKFARIHLSVAPECNIQCSFCNRDYDCVNESRPGVTSKILTPNEALERFIEVKKKIKNISIVGFAGPGDPLANWEKVRKTVELIKNIDKEVDFCLSTNALNLPQYAGEIIKTGFSHITITINALTPETAAQIYTGVDVKELLRNQIEGLKYLSGKGIKVKINTIFLKSINEHEIENIAKLVSDNGACMMNIRNVVPDPSPPPLADIRKKCSKYIKQMYHCQQCRADSVGLLEQDRYREF